MSQALTPAVGSKVGRFTLTAESPEALAASCFVGRSEDGQLARVLIVARAGTDAEAVTRAAAQAKNLAHANVLRLADADSIDGRLALSFEHVEGVSLATLVTAAGAAGLSHKVALRIALDLLEGLAAAHATGLGHGELGPHLAWVGGDGRARVLGIGVARGLGKALAPKTSSDRLAYIAPERVKAASSGGAPVTDPKCDVFSVAVMLWELLAKQRLFAGRLESAVIQKVLTAPVAPLASAAEDVPDAVDEALRKALDRDPARRVATARELADALTAGAADGIATHEEVAALVADLAKKPLEELRAKLASAGAMTASGELIVPPARPSFPTLDEFDVQADDTADVVLKPVVKAPPKAPPAPPKAAPKPIAKPSDLKAPVKPIEVKVAGAKPSDEKPAVTPAPAEAEAKPSDGDAKPESAEAKPASAPTKDAPPPSDTKVSAKPEVKVAPAAPKPGLRAPVVSAIAAKRPIAIPRKGTLLGIAPPTTEPAKAAVEASPKPPESAEKPVEAAAEKAEVIDVAPASKTPPQGSAAKVGDVKAEAPKSAGTPPSGTPLTASERTPSTGGSPSPASIGKRPALTGNLKPGDTLGRYELLLPVATGGMASVWAARLEGTAGFQKTVAIKTMLPGMSSDADFEEMFLDEARVAARIRHPNVVEIFDLGEEGETLYLVMEWVDGETFGALQKGSKPHGGVPLPILLRLASQACAGLHAAHELRDDKGVLVDLVHRDISPANLLVSRTGFVKIVDFGVAKSKARMYTTRVGGMLKGKTPYLSPEQLAGQTIDRRSDLYSFGAVLYVMATGLHPFRGETEAKTIENIALREPVPPRKIDPNIHPELEAIILKALAKDRDKRFETASEMQRAIDTLAASIGQAVNDDDVAGFVKKVAGDSLEKRSGALREAIAVADTGKLPIQPRGTPAPESTRTESVADKAAAEAAAEKAAAEKAAAEAAAEKVDIGDVDISEEPVAAAKPEASDEAPPPKPTSSPAIPPPPLTAADADPLFTAPSLGSDASPFASGVGADVDRTSPPDTLAAASTEPVGDLEAPPPRKRGPLLVVGGILGVCALIGVIALAQSGGGKPSASGASTSVVAAQNPETQRTGKPADVPPPATEAPTTAAAATPAPATTEAPAASATATATPEPVASAEPTADTPPPAKVGQGHVPTTTTTAASKPTVATKPTAPPKSTAPPKGTTTKPTKPPPKREFNTL